MERHERQYQPCPFPVYPIVLLIRKGYVFNVSETPDETIKRIEQMEKDGEKDHGSLRNTYRQARYGNKEIDDNTVKTLKDIS